MEEFVKKQLGTYFEDYNLRMTLINLISDKTTNQDKIEANLKEIDIALASWRRIITIS